MIIDREQRVLGQRQQEDKKFLMQIYPFISCLHVKFTYDEKEDKRRIKMVKFSSKKKFSMKRYEHLKFRDFSKNLFDIFFSNFLNIFKYFGILRLFQGLKKGFIYTF